MSLTLGLTVSPRALFVDKDCVFVLGILETSFFWHMNISFKERI